MARCLTQFDLGGSFYVIDRCGNIAGRPGTCVHVVFPDPRYCDGLRHETIYQPTAQEVEGYPDREWLSNVGDMLFDTVFGVFDTAISAATGGIVDQYLTFDGDAEELLARTIGNVNDAAIRLAGEIGTDIGGMVSKVVNQSAAAMGEFLGVAKAQERIASEVVGAVDYLLTQGEWQAETRRADAIAAAQAAQSAVDAQVRFDAFLAEEAANLFAQSAVTYTNVDQLNVFKEADKLLGFTFDLFEVNRNIMYDLATTHGINVANSFGSTADRQIAVVNDVLMESVIKPMAQTDAYYTALKAAQIVSEEDLVQSLLAQALAQAELAADLLGTKMQPLDYLRSRLEAD